MLRGQYLGLGLELTHKFSLARNDLSMKVIFCVFLSQRHGCRPF